MAGVFTRTRSKILYGFPSPAPSGSLLEKRRKRKMEESLSDRDVISLEESESECETGLASCSRSKKFETVKTEPASEASSSSSDENSDSDPGFIFKGEFKEEIEMIEITDDDGDDGTEAECWKRSDLLIVEVKEEQKSESDNEGRKEAAPVPVPVPVCDSEVDFRSSSTESEEEDDDDETSDEEFKVDGDVYERVSSDDDYSSSSFFEEEEDEKEKMRLKFEKLGRMVESESSGVFRKNNEKSYKHVKGEIEEEDEVIENTVPFSAQIGECSVENQEELKETDDAEEMFEITTPFSVVQIDECVVDNQVELKKTDDAVVATSAFEMRKSSSDTLVKQAEKAQERKVVKVDAFGEHHEISACSKRSKETKETERAGVAASDFEVFNSSSEMHKKKVDKAQETGVVKTEIEDVDLCGDQNNSSDCSSSRDGAPRVKKEQGNVNAKPIVSSLIKNRVRKMDSPEPKFRREQAKGVLSPLIKHRVKQCDSPEPEPEVKDDIKKELENYDGVEDGGNNGEKVGMDDETMKEMRKVLRMPSKRKEQRLIKLLAECFLVQDNATNDDLNGLENLDVGVHQNDTQPSQPRARVEVFPSRFSLAKVEEPTEKTAAEKELDRLWDEMDRLLRFGEIGEIESQVGNIGTREAIQRKGSSASACEHDFFFEEEIGIYCKHCGWIATDIKDVTAPFADKFPGGGSGKRVSSDGVNALLIDEVQLDVSEDHHSVSHHNEGTAWDLVPDIMKQSLFPHQQEGFEFIWTNMAGSIDLNVLKTVDPRKAGGCIISHAAGSGKTRLTMVFLQSFLQMFPRSLPVIIAPANLLLNWEDEFKKWDIGVPFHNLNSLDLSGKENADAMKIIEWSRSKRQSKDNIRMVKLYSWFKEKSILGISYNLYEKLTAGESKLEVAKKRDKNRKIAKKHAVQKENLGAKVMGEFLREKSGLLVMDEGHTPRNQRSFIWKVLSKVQAQKRIILSGTPFQNNFLELYNILCLVQPSFPESIPHDLKKFFQKTIMQKKKASIDMMSWEPAYSEKLTDKRINQLKLLMEPFVHVHKGSILQEKLPGLKDCVLTLKPDTLQEEILQSIESSQNQLNFEHKVAVASVHPSLFLCCALSEKEKSGINKDQLAELKFNPYAGVKTKFLIEFVRLCDAVNEKVLVFSQFIDTLNLILEQLKSAFNWSEGKELLFMCGRMDFKQKQQLIHGFNDANSRAKILLASIKACSEGINLVGASRVVLMDVVWNPSVERQAIGRAYRLGQTKLVYTYHLLTEGTAECEKYSKQVEKDKLSELVFSARSNESGHPKRSAAMFEDEILDQMLCHDKLKDMFCECAAIGQRFV